MKLFWFGSKKKWFCNWSAETNWFGPLHGFWFPDLRREFGGIARKGDGEQF